MGVCEITRNATVPYFASGESGRNPSLIAM